MDFNEYAHALYQRYPDAPPLELRWAFDSEQEHEHAALTARSSRYRSTLRAEALLTAFERVCRWIDEADGALDLGSIRRLVQSRRPAYVWCAIWGTQRKEAPVSDAPAICECGREPEDCTAHDGGDVHGDRHV
jgi:hypothetical protein